MTRQSYLVRSTSFASLLFTFACGISACAPEDDGTPMYVPPLDSGLITADASPIVAPGVIPDAGAPGAIVTQDSGVRPVVDSGQIPGPVVMNDAGPIVVVDSGVVPMPDASVTPDAGMVMRPDQGMGDGKDVVTIGDSWMNLDNSIGIQQSLEKISKRDYRNFGSPGTKLLDEVIPNQYVTAKGQGAIKTVIMTGGGNDIMLDAELGILNIFGTPGCFDAGFNAACKTRIDQVAARLEKLWAQMAQDGVQDVLIVGYSNKTNPVGFGTTMKSIDYSNMKIQPICDSVPAPLRCTAVDTDKSVPNLEIGGDGIHPTAGGYDALGKAVWELMQSKGMRR